MPTDRPALLVVDHGSRRSRSNDQLLEIVAYLRRLRPEALVGHAHMEIAPPDIATTMRELHEAGARTLVVLPYFLSDGRHLQEDVPQLVAAAAAALPGLDWRIGRALGPHPTLAALLLERAELSAD
ncbi:MAG: sirohydrochlorin chelatase [Planctomycetota bacterium]